MFQRRFPLWDENNEGSGGSSGSSEIESLKAEVERLRNHSNKLLDEKKQVQAALKKFDGVDLEEIKKIKNALESSEEAKLLAEGKLDEVVNRRNEKLHLELNQIKSDFNDFKGNSQKETDKWKGKYQKTVIENKLRAEAEKAKIEPHFIDFVLFKADGMFSLGEDGEIESRDSSGNLRTVRNKPLNPEVFIEQLKKDQPHLWPKSQGAGATGGSGNGGLNEVNPFIRGTPGYSVTEQSKLFNSDPDKARMLQEAAKHYIPPTKQ